MILKTARFISATLLLVWLGAVITMTFYVAPILFLGGSEAVPDSNVAADIIAPMLHSMEMTGWIVLPIVIVLHGVMWASIRPRQTRALLFSSQMLALAWVGGLYSGFPLALQPKQRPTRVRFFAKTNPQNSARLSQQHWGSGWARISRTLRRE
ncbi:hypothetical protein IIC65_03890 [Candidatus Sumerlaeota bacterium]|nr:hypothetical protein [Candidatus Sumerlaeota bacterium]